MENTNPGTKRKTKYQATKLALIGGSVLGFSALAAYIAANGYSGASAAGAPANTSPAVTRNTARPEQRATSPSRSTTTRRSTARVPVTRSRGS